MTLDERWQQIRHFFSKGVWEVDPRQLGRGRFFLLHQAQLATLVVRDFIADRCMLRASALTYTSLLSIVPLLALMFAVLKGFGVQNTLEPLILERIAVGSEEIVDNIITYINNTNVGSLGTVGLLALLVTVLALLSNIEESFNHIWGVKETRSLMRRFADYFSVVTFGPIFVLAAISMTATLQTQGFLQHLMRLAFVGELIFLLFKVLPYLAMWAAFTFLYVFMPNIKVEIRSAVIGGIIGGTLWQLGQWAYVHFQVGVARYNAIYGTLAALPILMVWIYFSWLIVLLGLEVTYASQNLKTIRQEFRGGDVNFSSRERVALTVLMVLSGAFLQGERPWTGERIGEELELPPRLVRSILSDLVRLGFVSVVQGETQEAFQPGRSPETLEVFAVVRALRNDGVDYLQMAEGPERDQARALVARLEEVQQEALGGMTIRELVRRSEKADNQ
jgi:membrane protein